LIHGHPLRVLITDGNSRAALAATRSLGRRGHVVFSAAEGRLNLAGASRYAAGRLEYPAPSSDPQGFVDAITSATRSKSIDVVLPMTDITTLLLTEQRAKLPPASMLPFSDVDAIEKASNKAGIVGLALETGVPVPRTVIVSTSADAIRVMPELTFPVVVKPSRSRFRIRDGWSSTKVEYARDPSALLTQLDAVPPEAYPVLLQERISGPGVGLFLCCDRGRPVTAFAHRRLREKPVSGGVSVLCESISLPADALEYGSRLLTRLNWHGIAMVEFKRDDRDNSLRLMEINGRFWGSLQLAIDAGVDFPAILLDLACGKHIEPCDRYRVGIRSRWFLGDLDALLATLRQPRSRLNLPASHPSRLRHAWDFLHLVSRNTRYEVLKLNDPMPGLVELRRWLFGS
jgi:predicted ATP-grasp superfamily ATP-dependent carboligase